MQKSDLEGFYINLDRSVDRREAMERGLAQCGLHGSIARFSARQGDDRQSGITRSELGCFLSHQEAINSIDETKTGLILEDDLYFPPDINRYLELVLQKCDQYEWDILFLNKMVSFSDLRAVYSMLRKKRAAGNIYAGDFSKFSIEQAKGLYVSGAGAYLIRPGAGSKLSAVLAEAALGGYRKPVDMVYLEAINTNKINAKFVFPYILGIDSKFQSTIVSDTRNSNGPLFNDILNLFVAGGELDHLKLRAFQYLHSAPFNDDAFIASQLIYNRLAR